jgi:lipopolysaccharide/colanic/teichoic acid biosynthesis glycosyltransferase
LKIYLRLLSSSKKKLLEEYGLRFIIKRILDFLCSGLALLVIWPIMLVISIAVKIDSRGPVLFKQKRLTKSGRIFTMYKFRTMIENAENIGTGLFNYENDFRVTRVGRFLRSSSLDELPQLFNIFKGDMSIVGPRPPVTYELGDYDGLNDEYKRRFRVLGGITGLAQVSGRNELPWDEKVKYDNQYIELFKKYGIIIDIKIIIQTVVNVFKMRDIYEVKNDLVKVDSDEEAATIAAEAIRAKACSKKISE